MKPVPCPSCRQTMEKHRFEHKLGGELVLDLCFPCQGIWFDNYESVRLTPGAVMDLFRLIHEHRDAQRLSLRQTLQCPHCDDKLLHGMDVSREGGKFNYHRCLQNHGRFTIFSQFMIEKGFVRQLAPMEIRELAVRVGTVYCTGCGAPVDIRKQHACGHCGAPIAILDNDAVEQALARYQHAEIQRSTVDVTALGDAIIERERARSRYAREAREGRVEDLDVGDLIVSGVELVWNLFKR